MPEQNIVEIYQLQVFLKGISPLIWRRLFVTNTSSLADLHYILQISMGWSDNGDHPKPGGGSAIPQNRTHRQGKVMVKKVVL